MVKTTIVKSVLLSCLLLVVIAPALFAVYCPYCGEKLAGDFRFCPHCGESLEVLRGVKSGAVDDKQDDDKKGGDDEKAENWYRRHDNFTRKEVDDYLAAGKRMLVDFENMELITSTSSYYLFQLDSSQLQRAQ